MTYESVQALVEGAEVRELYSFALASGSYHLTSHNEDVVYNAVTYTATPGLSRGNTYVSPLTQHREVELVLPRNHPIVLGLIPTPPRTSHVSIVQIHADSTSSSSDRRQLHYGDIANMLIDKDRAQLRVPGAIDVVFDVDLPVLRLQTTCQHQLYEQGCGIARSGTSIVKTPTVVSVNGIQIEVSALSGWGDQTARFGEIVRTSDGERRSILDHQGTTLIVDVPFATLNNGDALEVARGCDKTPGTCRGDFANIRRFGGHPALGAFTPGKNNPGSPTGKGIG